MCSPLPMSGWGKKEKMFDLHAFKVTVWDIKYVVKTALPSLWGWGKAEKIKKGTNALET